MHGELGVGKLRGEREKDGGCLEGVGGKGTKGREEIRGKAALYYLFRCLALAYGMLFRVNTQLGLSERMERIQNILNNTTNQ
jgi:hypothetical protein